MMTDIELLERYVTRDDREALDQLLGRHYPAVYSVTLRLVHHEFDARDVAQSVFLQAIRKAGTVKDPSRFRHWLLKIAVNESRQFHRKGASRPKSDPLFDAYVASKPESVPDEVGRREFELALEQALEAFPETLKTPLVLRYYQSLSLQEIADVLELPKSTIQSRCELGIQRLRERFSRRQMAAFTPFLNECSVVAPIASAVLAGGLVMKILAVSLALGALFWLASTSGLLGGNVSGPTPVEDAQGETASGNVLGSDDDGPGLQGREPGDAEIAPRAALRTEDVAERLRHRPPRSAGR